MGNSSSVDQSQAAPKRVRFTERPARDLKMVIGGGLTLLAGALSISNGFEAFLSVSERDLGSVSLCAAPMVVFGIIAVVGGLCALRDKHFSLALAGAFLGALGDGLTGFVAGMSALFLFFLSNKDF